VKTQVSIWTDLWTWLNICLWVLRRILSDFCALFEDSCPLCLHSPAFLKQDRSVIFHSLLWNIACQLCPVLNTQQHQRIPLHIPSDNKVRDTTWVIRTVLSVPLYCSFFFLPCSQRVLTKGHFNGTLMSSRNVFVVD